MKKHSRPSPVLVATISHAAAGPRDDPAKLLEYSLQLMDQVTGYQPDILCLPENCLGRTPLSPDSPLIESFASWARANNSYLIVPLSLQEESGLSNSALLFDRKGNLHGKYTKRHLTEMELSSGKVPGSWEPPVFETDFGTIGIQICFDINWHDGWRMIQEQGARFIFWASAYPAPRQLSALAWMTHSYVISSVIKGSSRIFDISGDLINMSGNHQQFTVASLAPDKQLFEIDFHGEKLKAITKKYGRQVQISWQHEEDWFTLQSNDPNLGVQDLIQEFDLTPKIQYHHRCFIANQQARPKDSKLSR